MNIIVISICASWNICISMINSLSLLQLLPLGLVKLLCCNWIEGLSKLWGFLLGLKPLVVHLAIILSNMTIWERYKRRLAVILLRLFPGGFLFIWRMMFSALYFLNSCCFPRVCWFKQLVFLIPLIWGVIWRSKWFWSVERSMHAPEYLLRSTAISKKLRILLIWSSEKILLLLLMLLLFLGRTI